MGFFSKSSRQPEPKPEPEPEQPTLTLDQIREVKQTGENNVSRRFSHFKRQLHGEKKHLIVSKQRAEILAQFITELENYQRELDQQIKQLHSPHDTAILKREQDVVTNWLSTYRPIQESHQKELDELQPGRNDCHSYLKQLKSQLDEIHFDRQRLNQLIENEDLPLDQLQYITTELLKTATAKDDDQFRLGQSTQEPATPEEFLSAKIFKFEEQHGRYPNEAETQVMELDAKVYELLGRPTDTDHVYQSQDLRDRHTYIIGKSGSGKTTLMLNMIYQDLKAGNGLGVIAPEQEMLTEQILPYIPEDRLDDVIYFNPADENPIPFNPLNLDPDEDADLKADEVMTIFKRIIGTEGTPRIDEILRQSIYALLTTPNTTILDIPKLLDRADPDYRHQIISQLQDEYCAHFWRDTYPQFPKDAHLPVLYRIGAFTRDKRIRNTLCRTGESLNFRQVMDTGKVILFNLSDGILGEQNSQLLGQLIVSQFQLAVACRANIPEQQRKRFYLYIDEFQTFTNTATSSYEKILSRARKYRLALTLAHQQTGQIPTELLKDIFGNVSTMVCFNVSHTDANKLSKEMLTEQNGKFAPTPPEQFVQLEVGETYCKLGRESFKMKTPLITEQPNWDIKEKIIEHSRQQFTSETPTPMATAYIITRRRHSPN